MTAPSCLPTVSVLAGASGPRPAAREGLEGILGPVLLESGGYPFDMSDYYAAEMGGGLVRVWLVFGTADPSMLPGWKADCASLEDSLREGGRRTVNIDPGYLDLGKLVLASSKEAPDKVYMGGGVWAHTCLRYRDGGFTAPDHSFPDFRDGRFDGFMLRVRTLLRRLRAGLEEGGNR